MTTTAAASAAPPPSPPSPLPTSPLPPAPYPHFHQICRRPCASQGGRVKVSAAPEPDEILWGNLELNFDHEVRAKRVGMLVISSLCVLGAACIVALKALMVHYKQEKQYGEGLMGSAYAEYLLVSNLISVGISFVSLIVKSLINFATVELTKRGEGGGWERDWEADSHFCHPTPGARQTLEFICSGFRGGCMRHASISSPAS